MKQSSGAFRNSLLAKFTAFCGSNLNYSLTEITGMTASAIYNTK